MNPSDGKQMCPRNPDAVLPWRCPRHPNAYVQHSWDEKHYVMNGYPVGLGSKSNHRFECAECGLELQPDFEAKEVG